MLHSESPSASSTERNSSCSGSILYNTNQESNPRIVTITFIDPEHKLLKKTLDYLSLATTPGDCSTQPKVINKKVLMDIITGTLDENSYTNDELETEISHSEMMLQLLTSQTKMVKEKLERLCMVKQSRKREENSIVLKDTGATAAEKINREPRVIKKSQDLIPKEVLVAGPAPGQVPPEPPVEYIEVLKLQDMECFVEESEKHTEMNTPVETEEQESGPLIRSISPKHQTPEHVTELPQTAESSRAPESPQSIDWFPELDLPQPPESPRALESPRFTAITQLLESQPRFMEDWNHFDPTLLPTPSNHNNTTLLPQFQSHPHPPHLTGPPLLPEPSYISGPSRSAGPPLVPELPRRRGRPRVKFPRPGPPYSQPTRRSSRLRVKKAPLVPESPCLPAPSRLSRPPHVPEPPAGGVTSSGSFPITAFTEYLLSQRLTLEKLKQQQQRPTANPGANTPYEKWHHSADYARVNVMQLWADDADTQDQLQSRLLNNGDVADDTVTV